MDIFDTLKSDHERVKALMKKIADGSNGAIRTREQTFLQLKEDLLAHSKVEEAVFYAAVKGNKNIKENILEALNEHHIIELLVAELDSMPKDSEHWKAKFTFLRETVEHHVKEEESEMFEKARKLINQDEAEGLGELMLRREEAFKEAVSPIM